MGLFQEAFNSSDKRFIVESQCICMSPYKLSGNKKDTGLLQYEFFTAVKSLVIQDPGVNVY